MRILNRYFSILMIEIKYRISQRGIASILAENHFNIIDLLIVIYFLHLLTNC